MISDHSNLWWKSPNQGNPCCQLLSLPIRFDVDPPWFGNLAADIPGIPKQGYQRSPEKTNSMSWKIGGDFSAFKSLRLHIDTEINVRYTGKEKTRKWLIRLLFFTNILQNKYLNVIKSCESNGRVHSPHIISM